MKFDDFVILKKSLTKNGHMSFNIASDSMTPLIKVNDKIETIPVNPDDLELFDIIVFWQFDRLLCHFIIKTGSTLNTASLMNKVDFPVRKELLLGKVTNFKLSIFQKIRFTILRILN